jgi:hypothetical protein
MPCPVPAQRPTCVPASRWQSQRLIQAARQALATDLCRKPPRIWQTSRTGAPHTLPALILTPTDFTRTDREAILVLRKQVCHPQKAKFCRPSGLPALRTPMKKPTAAFILSFILPGAGLAYLGKWKWAFINFGVVCLVGVAAGLLLSEVTLHQYGNYIAVACSSGSAGLAQALTMLRNQKLKAKGEG